MKLQIRVNGTAPAWPLFLGEENPFYSASQPDSLGSASYSVQTFDNRGEVTGELLIDAGHNTVPFLLRHGNRLPDAVILTHSHPDHVLGLDWIVQSHRFTRGNAGKYPVYCTRQVWQKVMESYGHIEPWTDHRELLPGIRISIKEVQDLAVTAFPVYHGKGATGASMILLEDESGNNHPVLFTGDMLCPLLRKKDIPTLAQAKTVFIDTNNRFPDPQSNHISFSPCPPGEERLAEKLQVWFAENTIDTLIHPHILSDNLQNEEYFHEFRNDWSGPDQIPHSILDFIRLCPIPEVYLVHYFGIFDRINYGQKVLSSGELR